MTRAHYLIRRSAAVIIGIVFFLSGTLKLMDPVGNGLIVTEYFKFFHVGFLASAAKVVGVALSLVEALAGTALITGAYRRLAAMVSGALIVLFTIVTFLLWIFNPDMDCGCFGEAIHLTHGQTLLKNIILILLAAIAFLPFRDFGRHKGHRLVGFWLEVTGIVVFAIYSLLFIPPMDFTEFDLTSRLLASEASSHETDEYVSTFVYEKNGQTGTFTLDNLPDSTWTFVRTETVLRRDNVLPDDLTDLAFCSSDGTYADSLAAKGLVMIASVYEPAKLGERSWERLAQLLSDASGAGFTPLLLMAATPGSAEGMIPYELSGDARATIMDNAYYCDYKTLISLNRANGGAVYYNDGELIEKWSARTLPDAEKIRDISDDDATDLFLTVSTKGRLTFQSFYLYSLIILAFV